MLIRLRFLWFFLLLFLAEANAQVNGNSPYSRYGLGDITDDHFMHLRQMGGLGSSFADGYHINIVNPASYSFLNSTAFDVGVFAKRSFLEDRNGLTKVWSGNLEYISLAFPLRNPLNDIYDNVKRDYKLAMAFTLMPQSSVNYNISALDSLENSVQYVRNFFGKGGTYKFLWGNSIKYKNISFGVNMGYLFGRIQNDSRLFFREEEYAYNDIIGSSYNVSGFLWNAGFLYYKVLNKSELDKNATVPTKRITIGINFNSATNFSTSSEVFHRLVQQLPNGTDRIDTLRLDPLVDGSGRMPANLGLGATYYYGEKFAVGLNYSTKFWSQYFNQANNDAVGTLRNETKMSVGGFFRPNFKSFDNFFKRVYYRYGLYYETDPRVINGNQIDGYGLTLGFGLPFVFQRKISHVNLGFNLGIRGQNTPISEKFVKINLGVTFNDDEWFLKRKYN